MAKPKHELPGLSQSGRRSAERRNRNMTKKRPNNFSIITTADGKRRRRAAVRSCGVRILIGIDQLLGILENAMSLITEMIRRIRRLLEDA
jgi:hypothetical protein